MCQAAPARVVRVEQETAWIAQHGHEVPLSLVAVGDVKVGEYVYHHAGLALERLEPEVAREILALFDELDAMMNGTDET